MPQDLTSLLALDHAGARSKLHSHVPRVFIELPGLSLPFIATPKLLDGDTPDEPPPGPQRRRGEFAGVCIKLHPA